MKMPPIVAKCDVCGKGFVYMMSDRDSQPCPYTGCGGDIRRLDEPIDRDGVKWKMKRVTHDE